MKKCLSKIAIAKNYLSKKWEAIHKKIYLYKYIIVVVRVLDFNLGVPGPKLLDGSKVSLAFHSSAVNQMSNMNLWGLSDKK